MKPQKHSVESMPWLRGLPKEPVIGHPKTIQDLSQAFFVSTADTFHYKFLSLCENEIKKGWLREWKDILALGPFVNRRYIS
jgi:hypothetical protein